MVFADSNWGQKSSFRPEMVFADGDRGQNKPFCPGMVLADSNRGQNKSFCPGMVIADSNWGQKSSFRPRLLFLEHKVNRQDQKDKTDKVIESELLVLEDRQAEDDKDCEGYHLLNDLKLHERERTASPHESHPVGRYLKTVFKECYDPAYRYHTYKWK